ncbi:nucleic acid-binding, OB-fold protein [Artemisia annua]|uniref:Nucleic acid-binding, OB-fold protein n=1 Tax=Artemisia annua TaxID=35608 RepID=A0A2U1LHK6_ARTAN|nr:nucleic acid-binding, OB-fold protein [Artemisia annua]
MPKTKQPSNIQPFVRAVNFEWPFGDVSGLERQGSIEGEVPSVSHRHEHTFYGHNAMTLMQHEPCGSSRPVVDSRKCHSLFREGEAASTGGTTTATSTHEFQTYDNTLFQPNGSIPYNGPPSCLAYTETAHAYSVGPVTANPLHVYQTYGNMLFEKRGSDVPNIQGQLERTERPLASKGHACKRSAGLPLQGVMLQGKRRKGGYAEQRQQNVGDGKGNSHYTNEICYLYSDVTSVDLQVPPVVHGPSAMPLPVNERPLHSGNAHANAEGYISVFGIMWLTALARDRKVANLNYFATAAASPSILQPHLPEPAVATNVSDSPNSRGERQQQIFQRSAVRRQGNSSRRASDYASATTSNGEGPTAAYIDIGDADWRCHWCGTAFWFAVAADKAMCVCAHKRDPPESIKQLFKDKHFMENIRAYNQMFSMTSFGAEIDDTVNNGRGPYVFKVVEQLIQILDSHNELVALFRTARDICNENEVPDFTVRLYNVDGARQYDLPSTDILGAIIFESGPETETEYDVIIHKKGERPQRINKLHSTYMALQFPLLFVYGQPGMALVSATLSCIRDLKPGDTEKILELKVYRVWASRNPPDTTETGYRAILLDRHGDAIQANMDADDIHHFKPILIPGQAIRVSDFECTPTDKWQRTLENPTSLSFKRLTKIDAIPAESFPNHYFHFTSYNQLPTKVWDPRDKGIKDYPILTDYIGCYITSGEAGNVGNPTTNQSRLRKVEIQNLNRISIELTLWDHLADKFEKQEIEKLERPIIIAVTSCRVTKFLKRDLQLTSTPATHYYINPDIPDLQQYKAAYKALYEEKEPLCVTRYMLNDNEQEQQKNRIPFQQLFKHKAATYKGVRFTCQATISKLNTGRGWYYTSCCVCISKVTYEDGNYKCKIHGVIPAPNYRATLTDGTDSATFIFFSPKADDFIGVNCGDLVASNQNLERGHFPNEIEAIVGTAHTFQFHYNTTSNPGVTEFVMDEVFGTTDRPKQIESELPKALPAPTTEPKSEATGQSTGHGDSPKVTTPLPKTENVQPKGNTAVLKKEQETTLPKTENVHPEGDTAVLKKEQETQTKEDQHSVPQTQTEQETTPPHASSVTMKSKSKTEMDPHVAPKPVKRRIFTEEPSEKKKKQRTRMQSRRNIFCTLNAGFLAALKNCPTM